LSALAAGSLKGSSSLWQQAAFVLLFQFTRFGSRQPHFFSFNLPALAAGWLNESRQLLNSFLAYFFNLSALAAVVLPRLRLGCP
jgi:hypothetical protein